MKKNNSMKSHVFGIRFKFVVSFFIASMLTTITQITFFTVIALMMMSRFHNLLQWINDHIIVFLLSQIGIYIVLTMIYYWLLTKNRMDYFSKIQEGIANVAGGDFNILLPVYGNDELASLADNVNRMASRLNDYEEERVNIEASKERLVSSISHDIRTPLTSVLGYIDLIVNKRYEDNESLDKYAAIASEKGHELQKMVEALFEYNKLASKDYPFKPVKVNLNEILSQVMVGFVPMFKETTVSYRLKLPDEPIFILADPMLISRMMSNLIGNALKYSDMESEVGILLKMEEDIVFQVTNHGPTIHNTKYVFERFYKEDISRGNNRDSSGLGLAIVKNIVERHEGTMSVTSHNGRTTFHVRLKPMVVLT